MEEQKPKREGELEPEIGQVETRALQDTDFEEAFSKLGEARFHSRMNLVLTVRGFDDRFVYDAEQIDQLVIGRFDPNTNTTPPLDLNPFDAADKGVSRRHAAVIRRDGVLCVVDMGSPNGTFLNGQRLIPNQPRILRDGDDLRLGHLVLQIKFEGVTDRL